MQIDSTITVNARQKRVYAAVQHLSSKRVHDGHATYSELAEKHNVCIASSSRVKRIGSNPHEELEASDGHGRKRRLTKDE